MIWWLLGTIECLDEERIQRKRRDYSSISKKDDKSLSLVNAVKLPTGKQGKPAFCVKQELSTVPIIRKTARTRFHIIVVDDDEAMLEAISIVLIEAGFKVTAFTTSDDASKYLGTFAPDLIISDVHLKTSTMGGFSFYEKIREHNHLTNVPFIFLSGLSDEILIRTGKKLGVDDFLVKPIEEETLLSVVNGKIKHYQRFKTNEGE